MKATDKARLGGYIGCTIGLLGWVLGFAFVCLVSGHADILGEVFVPGLLISLSMAATVIIILESVIRSYGARGPVFFMALWGMLLVDMGVLILLINHWLAPIIDEYPDLVSLLQRRGSVYRVPDLVPILLMTVGLIPLAVTAFIFLRDAPTQEGTQPKTEAAPGTPGSNRPEP